MTPQSPERKTVVPVLPLPNVILYPEALLPLHIFEPRYVDLIRDALQGNKQIVLALLQPGWEKDYFGRPPIFPIAGLGEIVQWDEMPGGKYNVLVRGLSRVRVTEEFGGGPYRIAQAKLIDEPAPEPKTLAAEKVRLLTGLKRMSEEPVTVPSGIHVGRLADMVTIALPIEIYRKQELFEVIDVRERVKKVIRVIDETLSRREQLRRVDRFTPSDVSLN